MQWKRLWQPRNPMFWMMLGFNVLSSLCTWAMQALPLNHLGLALLAVVALLNVGMGLLAAWTLMRQPPPAGARAQSEAPGATAPGAGGTGG
jgi:hypothetical protein